MPRKRTSFDLFDYDCDIDNRIIFLGSQKSSIGGEESGVDCSLADTAIKALYLMNRKDSSEKNPISMVISNPGGDFYHGMAIYGAIKRSSSPVNIEAIGLVASMASIILQAGAYRVMDKHARLMIHWGSSGFEGHSKSMLSWAKEEERINGQVESIYLTRIRQKNPEFKLKKLRELLNFDTWLSAEEALSLGLVDEII